MIWSYEKYKCDKKCQRIAKLKKTSLKLRKTNERETQEAQLRRRMEDLAVIRNRDMKDRHEEERRLHEDEKRE